MSEVPFRTTRERAVDLILSSGMATNERDGAELVTRSAERDIGQSHVANRSRRHSTSEQSRDVVLDTLGETTAVDHRGYGLRTPLIRR